MNSHPLHWGFVVLGWNALALAGVLMQIVGRFRELFPIGLSSLEARRFFAVCPSADSFGVSYAGLQRSATRN